MNLKEVAEKVRVCTLCDLCKTRTNAVPGSGNSNAKIIFIGEAPGFFEDQKGLPFVGKAGRILDELLAHIGLNRENVFITNIVKCRPPNNRDPTTEEIKACTPYLDKQIELINPKVIVSLGRYSMNYIFRKFGIEEKGTISQVRGKVYKVNTLYGEKVMIPIYHPAVATYNPNKVDILKKDFEILKEFI